MAERAAAAAHARGVLSGLSAASPATGSRQTIACAAPYGEGGLGQHLAQLVEDARAEETLERYYAAAVRPDETADHARVIRTPRWLLDQTPVRFSPGWLSFMHGDLFDRAVASGLKPGAVFVGFGGQALHSFRRARRRGYHTLELMAANSHVRNVARQHARAVGRFGIPESWLNPAQFRKTQAEYAMADVIHVASTYSLRAFVAEGIPAERLRLRSFAVAPRFRPGGARPADGVFRVVYVGALTVMKGVPVLLEAFARLSTPDAALTLVGGSTTRRMRRYLEGWRQRDPRIRIAPGDPLPHLQRADVCVHPSFEDGFGYAPMEALACGVPVIVTEDTGMKEHVREGVNGYVVPTGSWEAILERLETLRAESGRRPREHSLLQP
jgi:glycosyltransferase involved in cell wall biosynthesis